MTGAIIISIIGLFIFIKLQQEQKEIGKLSELNTTDDLRIISSSFSYILLNLSSEAYDFCKFIKTDKGKVVLKLRYSLPKDIYQKWMTLSFNHESKLTHFKITSKEINSSEFKIKFNNSFSSYSLVIEIKNNEQHEAIKEIFS